MKVLAPAKINLYLQIGKKRKDGYHELETIFQTISLYDQIEISPSPRSSPPLSLKVVPASFRKICPENSRNLAWRAAELFLKKFTIVSSTSLLLKKQIPAQAGLGGGSSDAAAVLKALSQIHFLSTKKKLSRRALPEIASQLGADVPFFLQGGCALARGIGEKIEPLPTLTKFWCVIVKPSLGLSTAEVYRWHDQDQKKRIGGNNWLTSRRNLNKILYLMRHEKPAQEWSPYLYNSFESSVYQRVPMLAQLKEKLIRCGAMNACLSGTGSALFGIASSQSQAEKIKKKLKGAGKEIWVAHSV